MAGPKKAYVLPIVAVLAFVAVHVWRIRHPPPQQLSVQSITVLPLGALSESGTDESLADSVTRNLIAELSKTRWLRVIPDSSVMLYKGTTKPLPQIARELNTDALVEGTVGRSSKGIRVTVELSDAGGRPVWAQTFEGDVNDFSALQRDMAQAIVQQIKRK